MTYKYATQITEGMVKAVALSQNISLKQSVELAKYLKRKSTKRALVILDGVIEKTHAVPYTRFNGDVGHRVGIAAGRFPVKTAKTFKQLLKTAISNAADQALDTDSLQVYNIVAHNAGKQYRYGRQRGRQAKNTHVEIVLREIDTSKKTPRKQTRKVASDVQPQTQPSPTNTNVKKAPQVVKEE